MTRAWAILVVAGLLETAWAATMKQSEGFTRLGPSLATAVLMGLSVWGLAHAMRTLPMGTAYAVWTGIGAVGAAVFGMVVLGEPRTAGRLASLVLLVAGLVGLKVFTPTS